MTNTFQAWLSKAPTRRGGSSLLCVLDGFHATVRVPISVLSVCLSSPSLKQHHQLVRVRG